MHKTRESFITSLRKETLEQLLMHKRRKFMGASTETFATRDLEAACAELHDCFVRDADKDRIVRAVTRLQEVSTGIMAPAILDERHLEVLLDSQAVEHLLAIMSPIHATDTDLQVQAVWVFINAFTANDLHKRLQTSGAILAILQLIDSTEDLDVLISCVWALRNAFINNSDVRDYLVQKKLWALLNYRMDVLGFSDPNKGKTEDEINKFQEFAKEVIRTAASFVRVKPNLSIKAYTECEKILITAIKNPEEDIRNEVVAAIKHLTYMYPVSEMHRLFEMDLDYSVIDILRYKDINKELKHICLAILVNMTTSEEFYKLTDRLCDQKFNEFLIHVLETETQSSLVNDSLQILTNMLAFPCSEAELLRVLSTKLVMALLDLLAHHSSKEVRCACLGLFKLSLSMLPTAPRYEFLFEFGQDILRLTLLGLNSHTDDHRENLMRADLFEILLNEEEMFRHIKEENSMLALTNVCLNSDVKDAIEAMMSCSGTKGQFIVTKLNSVIAKHFELY